MKFINRIFPQQVLAWVQLTLVVYALGYAGLHQFNNPAVLVEDCELITHHLHQDPHTHQCELCDYHLRFYILETLGEFTPPPFYQILVVGLVVEPVIKLANHATTRGPPVS